MADHGDNSPVAVLVDCDISPQSKDYYPRAEFLKWHEGQVFKRPGRAL